MDLFIDYRFYKLNYKLLNYLLKFIDFNSSGSICGGVFIIFGSGS